MNNSAVNHKWCIWKCSLCTTSCISLYLNFLKPACLYLPKHGSKTKKHTRQWKKFTKFNTLQIIITLPLLTKCYCNSAYLLHILKLTKCLKCLNCLLHDSFQTFIYIHVLSIFEWKQILLHFFGNWNHLIIWLTQQLHGIV